MAITPMSQGDTAPAGAWTLIDDEGVALPITGADPSAFALYIVDQRTGQERTGTGAFTIVNATTGLVRYEWGANDSALVGDFRIYVTVTLSGNTQTSDPQLWSVRPRRGMRV